VSTKKWPYPTRVIDRLQTEFYRFDFFQAMRIFERSLALQGEKGPVVGRVVCFRNSLSLAFPPSQIENLVRLDDEELEDGQRRPRYELTPAFFGLTGPAGVLPSLYSEKLIEREVLYRDEAARAFLDIFTNRMLSLFYGAWKKYRLWVLYEQKPKRYFLPHILSFVGVGSRFDEPEEPENTHGHIPREALAFYAGVLRRGPMPALTLEGLFTEYFRVPVKVHQFVGQWMNTPTAYQAQLSKGCQLGNNALCGTREWNRQTKLRFAVGPLSRSQWKDFLPTGTAAKALGQWLALTIGGSYWYELQLILKKEEIGEMSLSADKPVYLGWDSFLVSRPQTEDREDACFDILPFGFSPEYSAEVE
jgi:type VI secretion system protein ImpH